MIERSKQYWTKVIPKQYQPLEELDLPYIYWIPKMLKNPYKHRFIAGSSKCSTKPLSILLTKLLTHIKQGLQKYCETAYSRSGVNQMWILKNSKELLEHLQSPNFNRITSIKSFDFSTSHNHSSPKTSKQTRNYHPQLFYSQKWESQIQISGFRSRRTLFCQGTLRFEKQVHWRWHR